MIQPELRMAYIECECGKNIDYHMDKVVPGSVLACKACRTGYIAVQDKGWRKINRNEEWTSMHLGVPFDDPEWSRYLELAQEYHDRTDAFDAKMCTHEAHGVPMPGTPFERIEINKNAKSVRKEIEDTANREGLYDPKKLHQAIIHVARRPPRLHEPAAEISLSNSNTQPRRDQ
jgi:hypothetical protein